MFGIDLSLQRQNTTIEAGKPLLISGRITSFGIGFPTPSLIRVTVEGPAYDPEIRNFDTISAPITGDYSVNVQAEKDGEYEVYAKAYPFFIPSLPILPSSVILGPAIGESPKPPIVVGNPTPEGLIETVTQQGKETIAAPAPIYLPSPSAVTTIVVEKAATTAEAAPVVLPSPPPDIPLSEIAALPKQAYIQDLSLDVNNMISGDDVNGVVKWRNVGSEDTTFDVNIYFIGTSAYGPFSFLENEVASGSQATLPIIIGTEGVPADLYGARVDVIDAETGNILASRLFPGKLTITPAISAIAAVIPDIATGEGESASDKITWGAL